MLPADLTFARDQLDAVPGYDESWSLGTLPGKVGRYSR
jgi:hypothetical protein